MSAAEYYAQRTAALEARLLEVLSDHDSEIDESIPVDARQGIRSNALANVLATIAVGTLTDFGARPAPSIAQLAGHLRAAPWHAAARAALDLDAQRLERRK